MKHWRLFIFACVALLASGCATTYMVKIDSIADPAAPSPTKKYVLASGMSDVKVSDLYFREFAQYFRAALEKNGYVEAPTRDEASMEIDLSYGSSAGQNEVYSYTRPLYHVSGGERISYKETRTDSSGQKVETTGTVYVPLRTEVIGYTTELGSQTWYSHFVVLEANTISDTAAPGKQLWKTTIHLAETSNDLRRLIPFMAIAATPYLGTNTGAVQTVEIKPGDVRVQKTPTETTNPTTQ